MRISRAAALIGLFAGVALAGVLALLNALKLAAFVPLDIANTIIAVTPGDIATTTIETLGPWGKRLVMASGVVGFIIAFVALAWIMARLLRATNNGLAAWVTGLVLPLGAVLLVQRLIPSSAAVAPPWSREVPALAVLFGLSSAAMVAGLRRLLAPAASAEAAADPARRAFLVRSAGLALGVAAGGSALAALVPKREVVGAGAALPTSAPVVPTAAATPTAPAATAVVAPGTMAAPTATALPAFVAAPGTRPEITQQESLYLISSSTSDPEVDIGAWRLQIGGAVDQPFELTYDELLAMARFDQTSTLECISNEVGNLLIGNCNWNGVRLRDLLERAGVQDGVIDIKFTAAEGYTESMSLEAAMSPETVIAYGIDGQALSVKHGFPARVRSSRFYGEKNVKWLTKIEAVAEDYQGYWQQRGWTDSAIIFTTAVIDTGNERLGDPQLKRDNGMVALGGIAFAGNRGIRSVELQIDGSAWVPVQLKESSNDLAWRLWSYQWRDATPGSHTLVVRAVDGAGQPQVADVQDTHPDGATGYHQIAVEVV